MSKIQASHPLRCFLSHLFQIVTIKMSSRPKLLRHRSVVYSYFINTMRLVAVKSLTLML